MSIWAYRMVVVRPWRRYWTAAVLFSCLLIGPELLAQQSSRGVLEEGYSLLRAEDYEAALERFEAVVADEPANGGALLLRGMAENRLGRHGDALLSITRAERLRVRSPLLDFEKGWAAVGVSLWDEAISSLERYEKAKPGNAKAAELLGRAYIAKGAYDRASTLLHEAIRRDPAVKPTALYYLAFLERARGKTEDADAYLETLFREAPRSPLARSLKGRIGEIRELRRQGEERRRAAAKPWRVGGSLAYGYNDNVLLLADGDLNLPSDVTSNQSRFVEYSADGRYDWRLDARSVVSAGYVLQGTAYLSVGEANYHDHVGFAEYTRRLSSDLGFTGRAGYGKTFLDGKDFSDRLSLRPALAYRPVERTTIEASYALNAIDFSTDPANPAQDRDGLGHTFGATLFLDLTGVLPTNPRLRADFAYTSNQADGDDFDYGSFAASGGIDLSLPWRVGLSGTFAVTNTNYDNPNSFSSGGITSRKDDQRLFRLNLSRPIADGVEAFGEYRRIDNESNIALFDYDQTVWSIGLRARF